MRNNQIIEVVPDVLLLSWKYIMTCIEISTSIQFKKDL